MSYPAASKVVVDGEVIQDLTEDTVTPETLLKGVTAHNAVGNAITGSFDAEAYESALAIVIDGDEAPQNITVGKYLFIKNHSTLATGGYRATAAIASGDSITSSNVAADPDGFANSIKDKIGNVGNTDLQSQITLLSSNLTDYVKFVDKDSGSISIPSLSHQELYYTISDLANYNVIAVTPINLGDDRLSFRGWRVDFTNNRVYVIISNPSASASNGAPSFRIAMVRK